MLRERNTNDKNTELNEEKLSLLVDVAELYYKQEMSQEEIAQRLHISRSNVSRMLAKAKEEGVVEIKINYFNTRSFQLEEEIKHKFGVKEVFVYNTGNISSDSVLDMLTKRAAEYISANLKPHMSIGVTRGSVFAKVLGWLKTDVPRKLDLKLIQLTGAEALSNPEKDSGDLIRGMLQLYGGTAYYLNAPLYVDNEIVKNALEQETSVRETMNMASKCDVIITGIGYLSKGMDLMNSVWDQYLSEADVEELVEAGAVGHLFFHIYDKDGKLLDHPINSRVVGVSTNAIKDASVVAVSCGKFKSQAVLGALRQNIIKVLFIDRDSAEAVLYS